MCGFAIYIGQNGRHADPAVVERMTATLQHRGPNDCGFWYDESIGIGFRRLAIIDLTLNGHQPMVSQDGLHVIAFNGEIFNYIELRRELRALNHQFVSTSDTEVLLASWRQWGDRCVDRLDGMFAFAIWDRQRRELFGARDRFGIKPLYVYQGDDCIVLASEIKAIQASGAYDTRPNWPVIGRYLVDGQLLENRATCFERIEQIQPAHVFRVSRGGLRTSCYFELPTNVQERVADGPSTIASLLERAVHTHMRSDVPLAVCLSGGIDSTSIICAMAREREATNNSTPLLAFNYNAAAYDESRYLDATIRQSGATLISWQGQPHDLWASFTRVLHFHDEPFHSMNVLIGFELMRLARSHGATVVLNGQGADEAFGGYVSYYQDYWATLVVTGKVREAWREIGRFVAVFGGDASRLAARVFRRVALNALARLPGYKPASRARRRRMAYQSEWFSSDIATKAIDVPAVAQLKLDDVQRFAVASSPLPLYLRIEDRNSMAHGVEARLPFLDHRLVSYALTLPMQSRINGPWNKYALREAGKGKIPEAVRTRVEKMGYPTPSGLWFARELYEPVRDLLASRSMRERGLYRTDRMIRVLDASRETEVQDHGPIFRAANVELWLSMLASRNLHGL